MNIVIKLLLNGFVLVPLLLWFTDATWIGAVLTSVIFSGIAYLIGDGFVLRAANNTIATAADGVTALIYLWAVAYFAGWGLSFNELIVTVLALAVVEAIFHALIGRERVQRVGRRVR
jgi:hypothetical protein